MKGLLLLKKFKPSQMNNWILMVFFFKNGYIFLKCRVCTDFYSKIVKIVMILFLNVPIVPIFSTKLYKYMDLKKKYWLYRFFFQKMYVLYGFVLKMHRFLYGFFQKSFGHPVFGPNWLSLFTGSNWVGTELV